MSKMLPDQFIVTDQKDNWYHRSFDPIASVEVLHPDYGNPFVTEININMHYRYPMNIGIEKLHNVRRLYTWRTKKFTAKDQSDMIHTIETWTKEQFDDLMKLLGLTDDIVMAAPG